MADKRVSKKGFEELELPETLFVRDIDDRVFKAIVLNCLDRVEGVTVAGGNFIDSLFGRQSNEHFKGITVTQENTQHSISVKVELGILYGLSIPEKAEEVQTIIAEEITKQSGLHVSCVHVVFRNVIAPKPLHPEPESKKKSSKKSEQSREESSAQKTHAS